jgi:hypothetical protein
MSSLLALRRGLVYEGEYNFLRAVHPIPILTRASCTAIPVRDIGALAGVLFREDSFDPVTRIRRGRMYTHGPSYAPQSLPPQNVHNYPFGPHVGAVPDWRPDSWYELLPLGTIGHPASLGGMQVNLGQGDFQTVWRIVGVELISTGEFLFTLRAASLFGVLPPLREDLQNKDGGLIDDDRARQVQEALGKLVDAFHVQQPVPIVDVARETAKVILTAWIGQNAEGKDLSAIISLISQDKELSKWAASIINRLHSRGKAAEQEKQTANGVDLLPVIDKDAEVSVHLVGLLLREIRWAQA